jgi:hypothetical protein
MSLKSRLQKLETKESGDAEILVAWESESGGLYYDQQYTKPIPSERIKALESSPNNTLVKIVYKSEGEI